METKWELEENNRGRISKRRQNMDGINLKDGQRKGTDGGTFVIISDTYY
jgi:hypothetical protein